MSKSGIEMLEGLLESITLLNKRFEVIDQNMKEILNRLNGGLVAPKPSVTAAPGEPLPTIESTIPIPKMPTPLTIGQPSSSDEITNAKVMSKIKIGEKVVSGVNVKIIDFRSQIVKETKTNRAGEWMCFLPPGKYKAEYFLEGMVQAKINFQVIPGQKLLRVAQPKLEE